MSVKKKLMAEIKSVAQATLFFAFWLGVFMAIKVLILSEYQIEFNGVSRVLVGALVLGKVVLILEHVSFGSWMRNRPACIDVVFRTALYTLGVLVVLILEKGFEGRHEHGGFGPSLAHIFLEANLYHILANTICVSGALLVFNFLSVVQRHLGKGSLLKLLMSPLPEKSGNQRPLP